MNYRNLLSGFASGSILTLVAVGIFSGFKTTRDWKTGFYTFNLKGKENVFVQNTNETRIAHLREWGEGNGYDEITSCRIAPNQDSYFFSLQLSPDGFNAGLITKIKGIENLFLDKDGDGFFDELWKSGEGFDINYTYTPKKDLNQTD